MVAPVTVRVRNLSSGGLMAEYAGAVEIGDPISIEVRGVGWVKGRVAWAAEARVGAIDLFGVPAIENDVDCLSDRLRITQTVAAFDFPRPLHSLLRPVGPIRSDVAPIGRPVPAMGERRRPFVFASLGTLQGHRFDLFRRIAAACEDLDAELLVAHCGGLDPAQAERLEADWVVDFADQMAALKRADICITHGGLNTVLDALAVGTPMLALPIAFDQPGVGARILHHGVGEAVSAGRATRGAIRRRLKRLLDGNEAYVAAAEPLRADIGRSGGAKAAAALVDAYLREDSVSSPVQASSLQKA